MITRDDVRKAALHNTVLYYAIHMADIDACTWEEAMMTSAVILADQNKSLNEMVIREKMMNPTPFTVSPKEPLLK